MVGGAAAAVEHQRQLGGEELTHPRRSARPPSPARAGARAAGPRIGVVGGQLGQPQDQLRLIRGIHRLPALPALQLRRDLLPRQQLHRQPPRQLDRLVQRPVDQQTLDESRNRRSEAHRQAMSRGTTVFAGQGQSRRIPPQSRPAGVTDEPRGRVHQQCAREPHPKTAPGSPRRWLRSAGGRPRGVGRPGRGGDPVLRRGARRQGRPGGARQGLRLRRTAAMASPTLSTPGSASPAGRRGSPR